MVESLTTKVRRVVVRRGSDARYLRSGHLVYAVEGTLFAAPFDVDSAQLTGTAVPVVVGVRRPATGITGAAQFSIADSGHLVYVPGPLIASSGTRTKPRLDPGM